MCLKFEWGGGRGDFSTLFFKLTNLARRMVERAQDDVGRKEIATIVNQAGF